VPFILIFVCASACSLVPIWASRWLPLGDLGGHIELFDVVSRYHDTKLAYTQVYALPTQLGPNTASLIAAYLLSPLDALSSAKLLLSAYVLALPLATLLLCRAFRRSAWLALFSFPLVFNALMNMGALNWLLGLPLILTSFASARLLVEERRWWWAVSLSVTLLLLLLTHVMAFLIGLGMVLAVLLLFARRWRDLLWLLLLLPSMPLFGRWAWQMFIGLQQNTAGRSFGTSDGLQASFRDSATLLMMMHTWGMQFFRDFSDELAFSLLLGNWLLLLVWSWRRRSRRPTSRQQQWSPAFLGGHASGLLRSDSPPPGSEFLWNVERMRVLRSLSIAFARRWALEGSALCCFLAYLSLPSEINEMEVINQRIVVIFLLLLSVSLRLSVKTLRDALLFLPVAALALGYPVVVAWHFQRFEREEVGELPALLETLPEGSSMAYVMLDKDSELTFMGPLWHLPKAIHALSNGGVTDDSFAIRPYTPVQYREGQAMPRMQPYGEHFLAAQEFGLFDYVLVRSFELPAHLAHAAALEPCGSSGPWHLFRSKRHSTGPD
jgi:hypothetical protein